MDKESRPFRELCWTAAACLTNYVFKKDYVLTPLSEVETFIAANSHLPNVPSEAEVKENGINMAEMDAVLLRKIEELTLYLIQLQKDNLELKAKRDRRYPDLKNR